MIMISCNLFNIILLVIDIIYDIIYDITYDIIHDVIIIILYHSGFYMISYSTLCMISYLISELYHSINQLENLVLSEGHWSSRISEKL